ncbi:MAG: c-type cytochrome [Vulcanimicrobiaceae bacterium]
MKAGAPQAAATSGSASSATAFAPGNATLGKAIFAQNCAVCHGTAGSGAGGGIGPRLVGEKARKNYPQTVVWIKNPRSPMPKLYPATLNLHDVENVAAYVQSL